MYLHITPLFPFSFPQSLLWLLCIKSFGRVASMRIYEPDREETQILNHVLRWKLAGDQKKCRLLNAYDWIDIMQHTVCNYLALYIHKESFYNQHPTHMNILHICTHIMSSTSYPIHEIKTNGINGEAKTTFAVPVHSHKSPNHNYIIKWNSLNKKQSFLTACETININWHRTEGQFQHNIQ